MGNRDRLPEGDVAAKFMKGVLDQQRVKRLPSTDHFSVHGTLIEARASMKSFKPKEGSDEPPGSGERNADAISRASGRTKRTSRRKVQRRGSITKAQARRPSYASWATLMENRNGLVSDAYLFEADGHTDGSRRCT